MYNYTCNVQTSTKETQCTSRRTAFPHQKHCNLLTADVQCVLCVCTKCAHKWLCEWLPPGVKPLAIKCKKQLMSLFEQNQDIFFFLPMSLNLTLLLLLHPPSPLSFCQIIPHSLSDSRNFLLNLWNPLSCH